MTLNISRKINSLKIKKIDPKDFNNLITIPPGDLKFTERNGALYIFDRLRRKYVAFTPEEFVRQNFVEWLIRDLNYPISLMKNEFTIKVNDTVKRCDTVIFESSGKPKIIIEYKAPWVKINNNVFSQIVRYNFVLNAPFLIISNGIENYCCKVNTINHTYTFIEEIPDYKELKRI